MKPVHPATLAVYVHWPFCLAKCPYCDFNSHVRDAVDQAAWRDALLAEITHYAKRLPNRKVTSVFFGGGTPSLMPAETVQAVVDAIGTHWNMASDAEITLEANPTSSESARFKAFHAAGINRVSLGIQSLNPEALSFLGRKHSADEALQAISWARDAFPRYSFDLIYARPNQTEKEWEAELKSALKHAGDHLSLYQLTIEPGTSFFHAHARGELKEIDEDGAASLYQLTQDIMQAHGLPAYEISNHAKPGGESRHNLTYWRYEDYIGVGPGAHGRFTEHGNKIATVATRSPEKWLEQVQAEAHGCAEETTVPYEDTLQEKLLMGLRLAEGISFADVKPILNMKSLIKLEQAGFIAQEKEKLTVQPEGRLKLNALLAELVRA